jgi:AcrR family transcriptional regulator
MGHRDDLLAGAVRCLREKGYAHTTARDIVAASGTNLGSIGYHYGSTEALLNAAVMKAIGDFGDDLGQTMATAVDPRATPLDRFEQYWRLVLETFSANRQARHVRRVLRRRAGASGARRPGRGPAGRAAGMGAAAARHRCRA